MYQLLGICLSLAAWLVATGIATLLAVLGWEAIRAHTGRWPSGARAGIAFLLRIAPSLSSALFVAMLVVPTYCIYEPRNTGETVALELIFLAGLAVLGIGLAARRLLARNAATRRLVQDWLSQADPASVGDLPIPSYRFPHTFPVIAIVGILRPRLFIARQVLDSLSGEEIAAAVAHEMGHLAAADNLKRGLMCWCRDLFAMIPHGSDLDRVWRESAESAADEYAARKGPVAALALASALIGVARLVPRGAKLTMPAGASLICEDPGGIASRVLHLTRMASLPDLPRPAGSRIRRAAIACLCLGALGATLAVWRPDLQASTYALLESIVSALQ